VLGEVGGIGIEGHGCRLEAHSPHALLDRAGLAAGAGRRQPAQIDRGVPLPRDALVQLHDCVRRLGPLGAQPQHRVHDIVDPRQILATERVPDTLLGEQSPAARLRAIVEEPRVGPVHRDIERERQVTLQLRGVEGDEVRAIAIGDQPADAAEQARPREQLLGQRAGGAVERGDEKEAPPCMRGDHAGQKVEVVVDDAGVDRLRG